MIDFIKEINLAKYYKHFYFIFIQRLNEDQINEYGVNFIMII